MKPIALIALFIVGATANYGYGQQQPAVRTETYAPQSNYGATQTNIQAPSSPGSSIGGQGSTSANPNNVPITRFNHDIKGSESSSVNFETGNGIKVSDSTQVVQGRGGSYEGENGQTVQSGSVVTKSGQYSYTAPDGKLIALSWTADENGFRPKGDHLPTSPPIPEEIAASLKANSFGSNSGGYSSAPAAAPARQSYSQPQYQQQAPMQAYSSMAPVRSTYESPMRSKY